jgi:hypothetical protein
VAVPVAVLPVVVLELEWALVLGLVSPVELRHE